jgi:hypothetical protein
VVLTGFGQADLAPARTLGGGDAFTLTVDRDRGGA